MAKAARVVRETLLAKGRFDSDPHRVRGHEDDGATRALSHEVYRHGKAAAVLLYDAERGVISIWSSSFAPAPILATDAAGDDRGLRRHAGRRSAGSLRRSARRSRRRASSSREPVHAFDAYMSPGGMTEKIACFVAAYGEADRNGTGGGVDEDEHIEVIEIPFDEALTMIERGEIADAKTIALLYYARGKGLLG